MTDNMVKFEFVFQQKTTKKATQKTILLISLGILSRLFCRKNSSQVENITTTFHKEVKCCRH